MTICTSKEHITALHEIQNWLKTDDYSPESMRRIDVVMRAIEEYSGMPLPARNFIMANYFSRNQAV